MFKLFKKIKVRINPRKYLFTAFGLGLSTLPSIVFAKGETPVSDGLSYITDAMYGATGISIATIAVMAVGLLCIGHVLKWSALGYTIMGVSIIFGADSIVRGVTSLIHNF